jgi:hypothetical protein
LQTGVIIVGSVDSEGARLAQYLAYFMWTKIAAVHFQPLTRALVLELNARVIAIG